MTDRQSLKIAIIGSRGFPSTYGGYETLVRHLARDWAALGHTVTVYCRTRPVRRRRWAIENVRCIWTPGLDTLKLSTLSFGATATVHALSCSYDAVLVLNVANGFWLPLLRARGIPVAVNTDGVEWERGKWGRVARRVFRGGARLSARYADVLIADSKAIGAIWKTNFGVDSVFVPYGADVSDRSATDLVNEIGLTRRRYVLVVARLIPENNVELVLDAVDALPDRPVLVVVGSGSGGSAVENRLQDLDRRELVRWLGHVSDQALLTQLWANAGVYVHGHSVGGTNPALLQALGAGAPTLALDTPFNREVLPQPEQLFAHDAQTLATRVSTVLGNPAIQDAFSLHGREIVRHNYVWSDVSARYLSALLEARRSHGNGRAQPPPGARAP